MAIGTFYIAQPQHVDPFMNCKVSETESGVNASKQLLIYDSYIIPQGLVERVRLENTNVAATICELAKAIEVQGCILEELKTYSEYLTKAIFSISNENKKKLVIDIHNKGAKDSFGVSSILMEPNGLVDSNVIKQAINDVMSKHSNKMDAVGCPKYICEVMDSFKKNMLEQGISLEFVLRLRFDVSYGVVAKFG